MELSLIAESLLATLDHVFSTVEQMILIPARTFVMRDRMYATMDQALAVFCDGLAVPRLIFSTPELECFYSYRALNYPGRSLS